MVLLSHPTSGISPQVYEALFLLINQHKKDLGLSGIYMITEDEKFEEKLACDRILVRSGNLHFESKQRYEEVA
jgi:ABC-type branched-subunit amino acid transport system ATPase component